LSPLHRTRTNSPYHLAYRFHTLLRAEVAGGNPHLTREGQAFLQNRYPMIMDSSRYPLDLVATVYARRRALPIRAIQDSKEPFVFDAGCGCGSDSLLFASLGARVLAVDLSAEEVAIGEKRRRHFEEILGAPLDVTFRVADLNEYHPEKENLSLTWLSSVLAIVRNQEEFLGRIYRATREGGKVTVVDFNLLNPVFLWGEWWRRRRAMRESPEFARHADFCAMVRRRGRQGARFFLKNSDGHFDDVQFFTPASLAALLCRVGFKPLRPTFSGFAPPFLFGQGSGLLERVFCMVPFFKHLGRAYAITGEK
jgi:SAM-dependent methyltransferase